MWNLRGYARPLELLVDAIVEAAVEHGVEMIILDPVYKVLGERSENSNEDVAGLLNLTDEIVERTGAAFVFAHHFAKGSQGGKFVEDRISGAGAWWRDPDAGIFMTPLEDDGGFNIACMARSFPPLEEFAARAAHPLMVIADDLDPSNLKQPGGRQKVSSGEEIAALLEDKGLTRGDWRKASGLKSSTFDRRVEDAESAGLVENVSGLWRLKDAG